MYEPCRPPTIVASDSSAIFSKVNKHMSRLTKKKKNLSRTLFAKKNHTHRSDNPGLQTSFYSDRNFIKFIR